MIHNLKMNYKNFNDWMPLLLLEVMVSRTCIQVTTNTSIIQQGHEIVTNTHKEKGKLIVK